MTETEFIPTSKYEITEGTSAVPHGTHEPRTMTRDYNVSEGENKLYMMSEIGDGVFVQWSQCVQCNNTVANCVCSDGPQEPHYITKWRGQRFDRSLNARPDVEFEALPSVVKYLRSQGYTVLDREALKDYADAIRESALAERDEPAKDASESDDEASDDQNAVEHKKRALERTSSAYERPEGSVYTLPEGIESNGDEDPLVDSI